MNQTLQNNENDLKTLDCLLISPPMFYEDSENIWTEINSDFPCLGLASIAAYARQDGYRVRIIDCNIDAPSVDLFEKYFRDNYAARYEKIRVVGLAAMTCTIKKAYRIAAIVKRYYPEATVVIGGVHATFLPAEVLEDDNIDLAVIGEGEITLKEILDGRPWENIKGIAYRRTENNGPKIVKNPPRERVVDLDSLPMPAYDLLPVLKYKPAKGSYKRLPAMAMMTSRGCPGRCTFCSKTLGYLLVFRSAQKIYEEIKYLIDNYGIRQIMFYDDTFTCNRRNVIKLCDLLLENKADIVWTCFARVDFVDEELLAKMKQAGCHQIMYGVENIDPAVLENINKKINLEQVENAVRWTKRAGIECRLAFMVGNPGDSEEVIRKNMAFIRRVEPDLLIVNITTPFPGTEMFKWAKERDLILTYDWDDYTLAKPIMRLENLSADAIRGLYKLMYRSFYFRPKFILKKIARIRSLDDIIIYLSGFRALLSFFVKKEKPS